MNRTTSASLTLGILALVFVVLVMLNNQLLSSVRIDLTENQVYSLSPGSIEVMQSLDEPVTLYFFFSDTATKGMVSLRNYANRVQSLLESYAARSGGKVRLEVIDPEPFSEAEDRAAEFGLTGAQISAVGDAVYFGLAGTNSLDDQVIIGFFDPQQEQFLEYEISKLIQQLSDPELPHIALVTDLPVDGRQNPMTGQFEPAMTFYSQLQQFYKVTVVSATADSIPDDTDLVILAHPQSLNEELRYNIDQFVMQSGKLLAFVDPLFESDPMGLAIGPSDLALLEDWGIQVTQEVLLDPQLGLEIRGPQGGVIRHPGIFGLQAQQVDDADIVTANLEMINLASVGAITLKESSELTVSPLLQSSQYASGIDGGIYKSTPDASELARLITPPGQQYNVGVRLTGKVSSAYLQAPSEQPYIAENTNANMVVIADVDGLTDRFWVQKANFFGETIVTPFANNGDLLINAADNLAGSSALISIRSRGTFARPFTRVVDLEVSAQQKFQQQEQRLQADLALVEQQLAELQNAPNEAGVLVLNDEQQRAIDEFVDKRIEIRKSLREVRFQLDRDIAQLGNMLKIVNIAVMPILLTLILWGMARLLRQRAPKQLAK